VPILIAAAHLLIGTLPMIQILALAIGAALCTSEIFYRLIELPSIKIGRLLVEKNQSTDSQSEIRLGGTPRGLL
jgi:peptidoglycan/LPS O-acetylase OafA/YrhL